ncbi:hypothetical protein N5P37_008741, partial [Trichoderma harzianum]
TLQPSPGKDDFESKVRGMGAAIERTRSAWRVEEALGRATASRKLNHKGREGKNEEVGGVVKTRGREAKRLSPGQAGDGFVFGG